MIIVDSDHLSYRSAASCEPTKNKPFQEDEATAIWRLHAMVEGLQIAYNNAPMEFYISGEGNWRKTIYPEYKANRAAIPKPTHLEAVREVLVLQYGAKIYNDLEVDDLCGIRMTQLQTEGLDPVCASLDKDLLQIPGRHYSWEIRGTTSNGKQWVREAREVRVSPLDGLRTFYKQVITGDASDNVPAFDGKFRQSLPKFVAAMLEPLDSMTDEVDMYNHVVDVYMNHTTDMPLSKVLRNAQVLYIKRSWEDSWQPPKNGQKGD